MDYLQLEEVELILLQLFELVLEYIQRTSFICDPIIKYAPRSSMGNSSFFEKLNNNTDAIIIK